MSTDCREQYCKRRQEFLNKFLAMNQIASTWDGWGRDLTAPGVYYFSYMTKPMQKNYASILRIHEKAANFYGRSLHIPTGESMHSLMLAVDSLQVSWDNLIYRIRETERDEDELVKVMRKFDRSVKKVEDSLDSLFKTTSIPDPGRVRRIKWINYYLSRSNNESEGSKWKSILKDVYPRCKYEPTKKNIDECDQKSLSRKISLVMDKVTVENAVKVRDRLVPIMESIIYTVCSKLENVEILRGVELAGNKIKFRQKFDFIIRTPRSVVCVPEITLLNSDDVYAQALVGCDIAAEIFNCEIVYGIYVTHSRGYHLIRSGCDLIEENHVTKHLELAEKLNAILTYGVISFTFESL